MRSKHEEWQDAEIERLQTEIDKIQAEIAQYDKVQRIKAKIIAASDEQLINALQHLIRDNDMPSTL